MSPKYHAENYRCGSCGSGLDARGMCPNCDYNQIERTRKAVQTGEIRRVTVPEGHHKKCDCVSCRSARTKAGARCQGCRLAIGFNRDYVRTDTGVMHLTCAQEE